MIPNGKVPALKPIAGVRELTRDDLHVLRLPRQDVTVVTKIRNSHHRVARLAAAGFRPFEIADKVGYSYNRITVILTSPAMQELIAHYTGMVDRAFVESMDDYFELATANMIKAERQLSDKLDEADENDETLSTRELIAISRDAADRFGYGKKQTNVNVNADFAAQLEEAIRRSGKTIEAQPQPSTRSGQAAAQAGAPTNSPGAPVPFRRRA